MIKAISLKKILALNEHSLGKKRNWNIGHYNELKHKDIEKIKVKIGMEK